MRPLRAHVGISTIRTESGSARRTSPGEPRQENLAVDLAVDRLRGPPRPGSPPHGAALLNEDSSCTRTS
ncbi:hypothetical protein EYF80_059842 [Liparis tanakae]|uniref:Uncharacterized protein n=1 Tax=Liparis tanakae TaxID=230148 RepID=A0A4Z2EMK6_9TELE|nr:hypothetical protein EYF80_059842 [Liparis tanakae]